MAEACSSFPTVSKAGKKYMYKSSPTNPFYKFYAVYEIFKDSNYISMNQTGFELFSFERTNSNLVLKFQMCDLLIPTNTGITMEKQNKREKENFICKGWQDGQEESLTCP